AASTWMAYVSRRQQADALMQLETLRGSGAIGPDDRTPLFDARSQQFEDWTTLSVFLFFFAGADAYVSAYLADFDDRIGFERDRAGNLRLRATIPVGARP